MTQRVMTQLSTMNHVSVNSMVWWGSIEFVHKSFSCNYFAM